MEQIPAEEYDAFVVKNREAYLRRFDRFDALAGNFTPTWHWPAFFFGAWWLLYRKLYLWALAAFVVHAIPAAVLPLHLACGVAGYYLYHRRARDTILSLHQAYPGQDVRSRLMDLGGVNVWVPIVVAIVALLTLIGLGMAGMLTFFFSRSDTTWV